MSASTIDPVVAPRPRLRASVRVGETLDDGDRKCVFVTDLETGLMLRVGEREKFLLELLDGTNGQQEVSEASHRAFGTPVLPEQWQALVAVLWARGLIEGAHSSELETIKTRVDKERESGYTLAHRRFPVRGALRVLPVAQRMMGWLFHPLLLVLGTLAGAAVSVAVFADLATVLTAIGAASPRWLLFTITAAVTFGVIVLHELGHGVSCRRFGGSVQELGLFWRFPILAPYCKVDSVMVLPRWHRVAVSFAGVYINLLALVPFWGLFKIAPTGSFLHSLAAALLLVGIPAAIVNLIPVFILDGYRMFEHATGVYRLGSHAIAVAKGITPSGRAALRRYPARVVRWSALYLAVAVAVYGGLGGWMVSYWWITLERSWGPWFATGFLLAEAILLMVLIVGYQRWKKSKSKAGDRRP